jgi:chromosomal replication initiation ATPase DnaA
MTPPNTAAIFAELSCMQRRIDELRRDLRLSLRRDQHPAAVRRVQRIMRLVAAAYTVPMDTLTIQCREHVYAWPRHVAMYLCRRCGMRFQFIGRSFRRDHGTAIHAYQRVIEQSTIDPIQRDIIRNLETQLGITPHP